jgi:2-polyprenyl-6-methoxyphenol hydroxylase-like FAD-dependent oxidoreductase
VDARAGIEQVVLIDPVPGQSWQPRGVDLHEPDVARAVAVTADGRRIQPRLGAGDRVEQVAAQPIAGRSLIPAGPGWRCDE